MGRLSGEARDRVRASSLMMLGAIVLVALVLVLYGGLIGYDRLATVPGTVVEVSQDGRRLTVQMALDDCQQAAQVHVEEDDDVVVLAPQVTERRPFLFHCGSEETVDQDVMLAEPLGPRAVTYRGEAD